MRSLERFIIHRKQKKLELIISFHVDFSIIPLEEKSNTQLLATSSLHIPLFYLTKKNASSLHSSQDQLEATLFWFWCGSGVGGIIINDDHHSTWYILILRNGNYDRLFLLINS